MRNPVVPNFCVKKSAPRKIKYVRVRTRAIEPNKINLYSMFEVSEDKIMTEVIAPEPAMRGMPMGV